MAKGVNTGCISMREWEIRGGKDTQGEMACGLGNCLSGCHLKDDRNPSRGQFGGKRSSQQGE